MSERIVMRTGESLVAGGPPGTAAEQQGDCRKAFHFPRDRQTTHNQHLSETQCQ